MFQIPIGWLMKIEGVIRHSVDHGDSSDDHHITVYGNHINISYTGDDILIDMVMITNH